MSMALIKFGLKIVDKIIRKVGRVQNWLYQQLTKQHIRDEAARKRRIDKLGG